jgi:hypothetical protein
MRIPSWFNSKTTITTKEISKVVNKPRGKVELFDSNTIACCEDKHYKFEVIVRGLERTSKVAKDSMLLTLTFSQT